MLLREMQAAFAAAIFDKDGVGKNNAALMPHIASGGADPDQRLSVYRNNVHHNFREALRAVYPVVERLVGERFFQCAADRYIATYPSVSGDLHRFGGSFADFLADFPPAAQLAYLPDTARLEWAMHEVFHAPDHAPLALERLAQIPQAAYVALRFTLHPACRLLASPFPVQRIWEFNQPSAEREGVLDIDGEGVSLLVRRAGFEVELVTIDRAEFAMLQCLSEGQPVSLAYECALQADEGFELARFIRHHVVQETIVDFRDWQWN